MSDPAPISIHIPPDLRDLTVPLQTWLQTHPNYDRLVVGALIFAHKPFDNRARILLVQRSANERAFPQAWEVPGGSAEGSDPTILHSVAREVFEETGLRLTRFVRQVGEGAEFVTPGRGRNGRSRRWMKLSFEVEVAEIPACLLGREAFRAGDDVPAQNNTPALEDIPVVLDPKEHQCYEWATGEDVDESFEDEGKYTFISADQRDIILDGFSLHKADREWLAREIESIKKAMGTA
ncbi:MAG: hypothetical protein M1839_003686 [Geoglossum umbratile]|nr:MAG: hypothetical protein M1839_003686 [Geoglossum umbratile]